MKLTDTIKFKFTMLYLAILALLLVMLAGGIYFGLSHLLHRTMDRAMLNRSTQLSQFPDIISVVASGTFEEETGEELSFYFYSGGQLMRVSHRGFHIPVGNDDLDRAIKGQSTWRTVKNHQGGRMRVYIAPFIPDSLRSNPGKIHIRGNREPGEERPGGRPGREPGEERPGGRPGREPRQDEPGEESPGSHYRGPGKPPGPGDSSLELDTQSAAIVLARPLKDIDETLAQLLKILLVACPLTLILSGCGGIVLAHRAFRPVEDITRAAREIQAQDLSRRIEVHTDDELGRLASTINGMLERLKNAFARQQQFTSDASHELRAPLAVIQAESTLALQKHRNPEEYERSLEIIAQEAEHMSALTSQLLTLARADAGKEEWKFETIELREFMDELCLDAEILCREKELVLTCALGDDISVRGDRRSLRRLMHNLLGNAINYTATGGTIMVELLKEEKEALLRVSDTGIGIPADELSRIFERFYRVDRARARNEGGSGLGLAMCRHIVDAHKGRIDVESQPGKGSTFVVRLPLDT